MAQALGYTEDAELFLNRSKNYKVCFEDSIIENFNVLFFHNLRMFGILNINSFVQKLLMENGNVLLFGLMYLMNDILKGMVNLFKKLKLVLFLKIKYKKKS